MKYRVLGKTGIEVSEVGLGTWQLGSADWGAVDQSEALAILHRSVENGVNFFDTADVYGSGQSEQTIGRFLRETKETIYVATKLGRAIWSGEGWPEKFTLQQAREATQQSLKNLGVDSLFLQQWHCIPTEMLRDGEVLEHLETLKREGLIQNWGCSVESIEEARLAMRHPGCATLQVIFNIFRQKLVDELLPEAQANNVGILARVPLASGLLTGRLESGHKFSEHDHRNYNRDGQAFNVGETFAGVPFEQGVEFAEQIKKVLQPGENATMAQLALRWILDHDAVSSVIPGASKPQQADSNAAASALPPLSSEQHRALRELYETQIESTIRGPY
jgi:aryl-alcohol dehydrogenase-like predicted oxidoreductase